jgi:hypothetical protein
MELQGMQDEAGDNNDFGDGEQYRQIAGQRNLFSLRSKKDVQPSGF